MKLNELALIGVAAATIVSCSPAKKEYASYELYPVRSGAFLPPAAGVRKTRRQRDLAY